LGAGCSSQSVEAGACEDFVSAFGDKAVECGFDRGVNERALRDALTGGHGCGTVVQVRDIGTFYDECIPSIRALSCAEFDSPDTMLSPSCNGQLLR